LGSENWKNSLHLEQMIPILINGKGSIIVECIIGILGEMIIGLMGPIGLEITMGGIIGPIGPIEL